MTFTEAAAEVLRIAGKPLHYKEITELAIEKNLLSHVGKSPEVTMGARLAALLKKEDKTNPIVRVKPGVFALAEWDGKKKKRGAGRAPRATRTTPTQGEGTEVNALEVEAQTRADAAGRDAPRDDDDDEPLIVSGEDALRADLAASGAELFDDEDDDDQPILSGPSSSNDVARGGGAAAGGAAAGAGDLGPDGGRRRRRRRRRRGGRDGGPETAGVAGERTGGERTGGERTWRRPQRRDRSAIARAKAPSSRTRSSPSTATRRSTRRVIRSRPRPVRWCAIATRSWPAARRPASTSRPARPRTSPVASSPTRRS